MCGWTPPPCPRICCAGDSVIEGRCREFGIDFTTQYIPVVPAAHFFCGGVLSTVDGLTDVRNPLRRRGGLLGSARLQPPGFQLAAVRAVMALRAARHPSNLEEIRFPEIPSGRTWTPSRKTSGWSLAYRVILQPS
jgi:hypothetical protein